MHIYSRRHVLKLLSLSPIVVTLTPAQAKNTLRIVAIGPGALRMLTYMDALDSLVGLEDFERRGLFGNAYGLALSPDVLALPSIGSGGPGRIPDLETLLALSLDLAVTVTLDTQHLNALRERAGIRTLALSYGDTGVLEETVFMDSLYKLGVALERLPRAQYLIDFMQKTLKQLTQRVANAPLVPAYLGGISLSGAHGLISTQAGHRPLYWANARNLADVTGRHGHIFIDIEQLLAWDPPILFIDGGGLKGILTDYAKRKRTYNRLTAVRNAQVYLTLPFNSYNTNVEHALINAWFMAYVLHPTAFADVDITQQANTIMQAFLGRDDLLPQLAQHGYGFGVLDLETGVWSLP